MDAKIPVTTLRFHYRTQYGWYLSVRGGSEGTYSLRHAHIHHHHILSLVQHSFMLVCTYNSIFHALCSFHICNMYSGLSWEVGKGATFTHENGEDVWELVLPVSEPNSAVEFKPLLNDEAWAKGHNYITKAGMLLCVRENHHSVRKSEEEGKYKRSTDPSTRTQKD